MLIQPFDENLQHLLPLEFLGHTAIVTQYSQDPLNIIAFDRAEKIAGLFADPIDRFIDSAVGAE